MPLKTRTYCGAHLMTFVSAGGALGGVLNVIRCCSSVSTTVARSLPPVEMSSGTVGRSGAFHAPPAVGESPRQGIHCAEAGTLAMTRRAKSRVIRLMRMSSLLVRVSDDGSAFALNVWMQRADVVN